MSNIRIDLYSDTHTHPTPEMRKAMSEAEVGDEQQHADPTVNRLVEMVADLLGKDDAIFLPSGTMCNQVALRVHCNPGDEIIMDHTAHSRNFEVGAPAALCGAMVNTVDGERGIYSPEQVEAAIRPENNHFPRSRVLLVEQTSNLGCGSVWPLETIQEVCEVARGSGLGCHMDGARLLNAVVASGVPAKDYAKPFDSVWIDFSKGLGAPVGAALAGSQDFINKAWRWKHQFGGAMRQAGIIAAGAIYALENHIERMAEDHGNAQTLAGGLSQIVGITVEPAETNLVYFDISALGITATEFDERLTSRGVGISTLGKHLVRAVTHLDVSREQVEEASEIIREVVDEIRG